MTPPMDDTTRLTAFVSGRVQGVGFRYWVRQAAGGLGLRGSATNVSDGRVEVTVEGPRAGCENLLAQLSGGGAPGVVTGVSHSWAEPAGEPPGFRVR
jgi:acylphosphatase